VEKEAWVGNSLWKQKPQYSPAKDSDDAAGCGGRLVAIVGVKSGGSNKWKVARKLSPRAGRGEKERLANFSGAILMTVRTQTTSFSMGRRGSVKSVGRVLSERDRGGS